MHNKSNQSITHLLPGHCKGSIEPLLKCTAALENCGQEEVEQGPELRQLVLQWCACEQQTPWGQVVCVQDLGQLTMVILHTMALVHNHVLPAQLWEETGVRKIDIKTETNVWIFCKKNPKTKGFPTFARTCLSLIMYSYVVSSTLNLPLRKMGTNARRAAGEP